MPVQGLQLHKAIPAFEFHPSPGVLAKDLFALSNDLTSFKKPLTDSVVKVMIPSIRANFDAEGRPPWPELSEYTIDRKMDSGYGDKGMLVRTEALRTTMGTSKVWHITDQAASIQDLPQKVWYGKVHQAGSSFTSVGGRIEIPQRQFAMFQSKDMDDIHEIFSRWLDKHIGLHWRRV